MQPQPTRPAQTRTLPADDVQAALAARQELGADMEPAIIETMLDRMEAAIDARVDQRVNARLGEPGGARRRRGEPPPSPFGFTARIAASLGLAIPLTAIAGGQAGPFGVIAVMAAICGLNVYYTEAERRAQR